MFLSPDKSVLVQNSNQHGVALERISVEETLTKKRTDGIDTFKFSWSYVFTLRKFKLLFDATDDR
jgi:hypothetical protein